ncbi:MULTISPECIES: AAA family ATPase [Stutzerimonas]|jgi:pilus assembly protein CpaE|uniref:AAA family ATPase n=1 Tax=Stutzerimonas balearica TaxID=74829 RepID=A0A9X7V8D4_9GAMM|nr:AAA family ATPase [Stutzerimonas balearica]QQN51072.1 AAA family ATPase [Stutzerimonas balearica]
MLKLVDSDAPTRAETQALQLLFCGRDADALAGFRSMVQGLPDYRVATRLVSNGHTDPLYNVDPLPDVLVLHLSQLWRDELGALLQRERGQRPALLICGPLDNREAVRLAMQAGARDFLPEPVAPGELRAALLRQVAEARSSATEGGRLVAVINAKGGAGATLIACNLAHQLSVQGGKTLLLDMDLQFGSVAHAFDVNPAHGPVEVLQRVDSLDGVALHGFCNHFSATLDVLGVRTGELCLSQDVRLEQLEALLDLARTSYDWTVVDLPRHIDHLTGVTLEKADRIYLVLQQSVGHLKDAARLWRILRDDLGVQAGRIEVVVNRYEKSAPVSTRDIVEALRCERVLTLPNDYATVSECQNAGIPLELQAPRAGITRGLRQLGQQLVGEQRRDPGLFKRTIGRLFGG